MLNDDEQCFDFGVYGTCNEGIPLFSVASREEQKAGVSVKAYPILGYLGYTFGGITAEIARANTPITRIKVSSVQDSL